MPVTRADIVATARGWIDTPFQHMGRQPGVALDCAGLVVCVARAHGLAAADFDVPAYTPTPDGESMLALCRAHLDVITPWVAQPGDVVLVRSSERPQHLAVLGDYVHGGLSIIHAHNGARPPRVLEQRLLLSRMCRLVEAYAFRGVA